MPRLNNDIVAVRIPNERWLGEREREILHEFRKNLVDTCGVESKEVRTFNWMMNEICHLREEVSNLGWQLNPDRMGS